jgi:hypothetical protein
MTSREQPSTTSELPQTFALFTVSCKARSQLSIAERIRGAPVNTRVPGPGPQRIYRKSCKTAQHQPDERIQQSNSLSKTQSNALRHE